MGLGTLRRYHEGAGEATTSPATPAPVEEQPKDGNNEQVAELQSEVNRLAAANEAIKAEAARWKTEALSLGWEKPNAQNAPENGAQEPSEANEEQQPPAEPLDYPARSAKTAEWVGFAEKHPTTPPLDLTPRPGLRDIIVQHYLGE